MSARSLAWSRVSLHRLCRPLISTLWALSIACKASPESRTAMLVQIEGRDVSGIERVLVDIRSADGARRYDSHMFIVGDAPIADGLPFSLTVRPKRGQAIGEFRLVVAAFGGDGAALLQQSVITGFRPEVTLGQPVRLSQRCVGVLCTAELESGQDVSCEGESGRCVDVPHQDLTALAVVDPGAKWFDAGEPTAQGGETTCNDGGEPEGDDPVCAISCDALRPCPDGQMCADGHCAYLLDPCPTMDDGTCDEPGADGSGACARGTDARDCCGLAALPNSRCHPVTQCGCRDHRRCTWSEDRAVCITQGYVAVGGPCTSDAACSGASTCANGVCASYCGFGEPCYNDAHCRLLNGGPIAYCYPACDFETGQGCAAGAQCIAPGHCASAAALCPSVQGNNVCDGPSGPTHYCAADADDAEDCLADQPGEQDAGAPPSSP